jgi:hypothetical protein
LSERDESESSSIILVSGGVSLNGQEENGSEGVEGGTKVTCSGGRRTTVVTRGVEETDQYVFSLSLSLSPSLVHSLSLLPLVDIGQTLQHWELSSRIEKLRIKAEEKEKEKNFPIRLHNFVNSAVGHTRLLLLLLVHFLPAQHLIKL